MCRVKALVSKKCIYIFFSCVRSIFARVELVFNGIEGSAGMDFSGCTKVKYFDCAP